MEKATNVLGKVYETLLCSPGMNETVKVDVKINRKTVLLLNSIIESGLSKDGSQASDLLELVPQEELEELKEFGNECLKKAGLSDLYEKLKSLNAK